MQPSLLQRLRLSYKPELPLLLQDLSCVSFETIAANKVRGIRAVLYHGNNRKLLITSKEHDDCNVLCLGARFVNKKEAKSDILLWLKTKFTYADRHRRRLNKIKRYESS